MSLIGILEAPVIKIGSCWYACRTVASGLMVGLLLECTRTTRLRNDKRSPWSIYFGLFVNQS